LHRTLICVRLVRASAAHSPVFAEVKLFLLTVSSIKLVVSSLQGETDMIGPLVRARLRAPAPPLARGYRGSLDVRQHAAHAIVPLQHRTVLGVR
jgi:hypothetical protein